MRFVLLSYILIHYAVMLVYGSRADVVSPQFLFTDFLEVLVVACSRLSIGGIENSGE